MIVINKIDIPFVQEISKDEEILLEKLWNKYCGPYIVDPVSYDQGLYIMYEELPKRIKKRFNVKILNNNKDYFKYKMEKA